MQDSKRTWFSLLTVCLLAASGCGKAERKFVTGSGSVTVEGEKLSGLVMSLEPVAPTTGPKVTVPVFNGEFSFGAESGLHGGVYLVSFAVMPGELLRQLPADEHPAVVSSDRYVVGEFGRDSTLTWELGPEESNSETFEIQLD